MKNDITGQVSTTIHAPVSKVWEALTTPEMIKKYFFGTNTITNWQVGSPIFFTGIWEGKSYKDKGTILAFEREKLLRYNYWSSMSGIEDKPENYVIITYRVEGDGENTKLTVTQENIPDKKMKEHSEQNWKMVLDNLKDFLEKKSEKKVVEKKQDFNNSFGMGVF
jgi:uncharacterized protein YndB with AHSA1/START domain